MVVLVRGDDEVDESLGEVVELHQADVVAACEEGSDLGADGLGEDGENLPAGGKQSPHDDEERDGYGTKHNLQDDEWNLVGEEGREFDQAEVAAWREDLPGYLRAPIIKPGEDAGGLALEIDEHDGSGDKVGQDLGDGDDRERKPEQNADDHEERHEEGVEDIPHDAAVGHEDTEIDSGEVSVEDVEKDLRPEEVDGGLRGETADIEMQPSVNREEEDDEAKSRCDGAAAEEQADGGGLTLVNIVELAAVVTHGKILIHVGLDAEIEDGESADGSGDDPPLTEPGGRVTMDKQGRNHKLRKDGERAAEQSGSHVLEDAL